MKNIIKAVLTALFLALIIIPANVSAAASDNEIIYNDETGIPDKKLYKAILMELGKKGKGKTFTRKEAKSLKELYIGHRGVKTCSLKGIEYLENLEEIDIDANITYVKGIEKLYKLTEVRFDGVNLEGCNYSSIGKIKNLKTLRISECNLTNKKLKEILGKASKIEYLDLNYNNITSIKRITKLKKLESLYATDNNIKSIKGIGKLKNLKYLYIEGNKIKSVKGIEKLSNLKGLWLSWNEIESLPNMKHMKKLKPGDVYFYETKLSEDELKEKLPKKLTKNKGWLYNQTLDQKIEQRILEIDNISIINFSTTTISGYTQKNASVMIYYNDNNGMIGITADENGRFVFENLNLKKCNGDVIKSITIVAYLEYQSDPDTEFDDYGPTIKEETIVLKQ